MKVTTSTTTYLDALVGEDAEAPGPSAARSRGTIPAPAAHIRFPEIQKEESCFLSSNTSLLMYFNLIASQETKLGQRHKTYIVQKKFTHFDNVHKIEFTNEARVEEAGQLQRGQVQARNLIPLQ